MCKIPAATRAPTSFPGALSACTPTQNPPEATRKKFERVGSGAHRAQREGGGTTSSNPIVLGDSDDEDYHLGGVRKTPRSGKERKRK